MTTTYDPDHPAYYDEADLRTELTRVYDLCHGCRLCFKFCPSFPTLFDYVDLHDGAVDQLTHEQQDQVVDECYQCKLCYVNCPYTPPHEWELDFPRLMLRAQAVKHRRKRFDLTDQALARTDLVGRVNTTFSAVVNKMTGTPGSRTRQLMEKTVGIAAERVLPPYARQRFSTWFRRRIRPLLESRQAQVAVFPTCLVEYQNPQVGQDLVKVYERNDIECDLPDGVACCGMPWLDAGDIERFRHQARRNVEVLAAEVRKGRDIVVSQPTCGYTLRKEYPELLKTPEARLVADHTFDSAEYLWRIHKSDDGELDTEFPGDVPDKVTYHAACHLRAQQVGFRGRDLIKLTGAEVSMANSCSGIDGLWGYRAENYDLAKGVAAKLGDEIRAAGNDVVVGDCHLANGSITEETGAVPIHPIQFLARAYGIPAED